MPVMITEVQLITSAIRNTRDKNNATRGQQQIGELQQKHHEHKHELDIEKRKKSARMNRIESIPVDHVRDTVHVAERVDHHMGRGSNHIAPSNHKSDHRMGPKRRQPTEEKYE